MQELSSANVSVNRFYDNTVHELVNQSQRDIPEAEAKPAQENKGWFGWVWGGKNAGPPDAISAKREQIKVLEEKLGELELKATVAERDAAGASGGLKVLAQQRNLAVKELMVEVKLEIAKELLEEYSLKFGKGSEEYKEMAAKVTAFEGRIQEEGKELLHQEAKFWGLRKLYDEIQGQRDINKPKITIAEEAPSLHNFLMAMGSGDHDEEVQESVPHSVQESRQAIANELHLENIGKFSETLSKTEKLELEIEKLTEEVDRITNTVNHRGQLDEVGIVLSNDELASLKIELVDEKIALQNKIGELKNIQKNELEAKIIPKLSENLTNEKLLLLQMENYGPGEDDSILADLGRSKADVEASIANLQREQANATSSVQQLTREIAAIPKEIRNLQNEKAAQRDVNSLAQGHDRSALGNMYQAGMNMVGNAAGRVGSVMVGNKPVVNYKWEQSDWGKLVANEKDGMFNEFRNSMGKLKSDVARLEAELKVKNTDLEQAKARLAGANYLEPSVWQAEGIVEGEEAPSIVLERKWRTQIEALEGQIQATEANLADTRIALHAAFLQRIISTTGSKQIEKKSEENALKIVEEQIIVAMANKAETEARLPFLDGDDKVAAEASLALQQKNYNTLCLRAQSLQNSIGKLDQELAALNVGFRSQMNKYTSYERGQRGLMAHMTKYATDTLKEVASLGFIRTQYVTPQQFDVEKQFADFGYTWRDGLAQFANIEAGRESHYFTDQVKSFLKFADEHPEIARTLVMDVAITLSCLADQSAYNTLLTGLRARGYTNAMLGSLGRNVEVPPRLTPETYPEAAKWKALGDFARYGPQTAQLPKVVGAVGVGLAEGNLFKAAIGGIAVGFTGAAQATLLQKIAREMPDEAVIGSIGALRIINGDEPMKVLDEQRNLAVLTMAGEVRRGITRPQTALAGARRILRDNWEAFKQAPPLEKVARFLAVTALPALGIAGAVAAIVLGGPLGIAAIIGLVAVSLFTGASLGVLTASAMNRIPGFRSSMVKARYEAARTAARSGDRPKQLRIQRDTYVKGLQEKGKLLVPRKRLGEPKLLSDWRQDEYGVMRTLEKPLLDRLEAALDASEDQNLNTIDIKNIFLRTVGQEELRAQINQYIESHPDAKNLKADAKKKLQQGMMETLQDRFVTSWLKPQLDIGFENELINKITSYDSPEQFEAAQAQAEASLKESERKLLRAIDTEVGEKLGADAGAHGAFVSATIKREYGYEYDPVVLGEAAAVA